jgi:hypothetical protein
MIYGAWQESRSSAINLRHDPDFQDDGTTRGYTSDNEQDRFIEGALFFLAVVCQQSKHTNNRYRSSILSSGSTGKQQEKIFSKPVHLIQVHATSDNVS